MWSVANPIRFSEVRWATGETINSPYFIVGGNAGHYVERFVVGDAYDWPYEVYTAEALMKHISGWLEELKRDLETRDLWAVIRPILIALAFPRNSAHCISTTCLSELPAGA